MSVKERTDTAQMNFGSHQQGVGAVALAAKRIAKGETIYFDVFTRPNMPDNFRIIKHKGRFYFGVLKLLPERKNALRVSHCEDLDAFGTESLIATWQAGAKDPVFIAARITQFLMREGSDWFIQDSQDSQ